LIIFIDSVFLLHANLRQYEMQALQKSAVGFCWEENSIKNENNLMI